MELSTHPVSFDGVREWQSIVLYGGQVNGKGRTKREAMLDLAAKVHALANDIEAQANDEEGE